jgi:dolichyl-phosphate beta-glucosyltransferase
MKLSVIIPAYNEEKRIGQTLKKIIKYLDRKKHDYEIIVVNDCSKDKTKKVVNSFKGVRLLQNQVNRGKGYTVKKGMLAAKKEWVLFCDADSSTPISMLEKMIPFTKDYDVIIGSRNTDDSKIELKQKGIRYLAGKVFPLFIRLLVVSGIKDTQCGFKLFKKEVVRPIFLKQRLQGWAFDAELLFISRHNGYKIKEVGVTWRDDRDSKLHLVRDSLRMLKDVVKIRWNAMTGKYR